MASPIVPCVWLDDQAEAAAAFYTGIFPASRVIATSHYPHDAANPSGKPRGSVLTVEVELAGLRFTLLNGGSMFKPSPAISIFIFVDDAALADQIFAALSAGGGVLMPLASYPWSRRYGWAVDRFGVSWQVTTVEAPTATLVPCLMYTGQNRGKAEEAMKLYASVFPDSKVDSIDRYPPEQAPADLVAHGRFTLAGQALAAMDSHVEHGFNFDEGMSLQVMCADQAEVDRYWDALVADGGSHGPCGWLKDRYGLSWQVVPAAMNRWMASGDVAARDRAFAAVMTMSKLDIAAIEKAYRGD